MEAELHCPLCAIPYQETNCPRLLTACGHTFCEKCIKEMISRGKDGKFRIQCPEDKSNTEISNNKISQFPKNIALLEMAKTSQKRQSRLTVRISGLRTERRSIDSFNISNIKESSEVYDQDLDVEGNQFLEMIDSNNHSRHSTILQQQNQQMCLPHQKPLDVMCIEHSERICVSCALFGAHKGHTFKDIKEISREALQAKQKIHNILNSLINQDSEANVSQSEFIKTIQYKGSQLKKFVTQYCEILIQQIKSLEKSNHNKISVLIGEAKEKIDQILRKSKNKQRTQFTLWEIQVNSMLQIFQKGRIQEIAGILYQKNISSPFESLLKVGESLHNKIKQERECKFMEIGQMIENLSIRKSETIESQIEKALEIFKVERDSNVHRQSINTLEQAIATATNSQKRIFYQEGSFASENLVVCEQSLLEEDCQTTIKKIKSPQFVKKHVRQQSIADSLKDSQTINTSGKSQLKHLTVKKKSMSFCPSKTAVIEIPQQKISRARIPPKLQKAIDGLKKKSFEVVDLTGADLGDQAILALLPYLKNSTIKGLKLARNQISDNCFQKILENIQSVQALNLSQNQLTEKCLAALLSQLQNLPNLKTIVLSQNRIKDRKEKQILQKIKASGLIVTL